MARLWSNLPRTKFLNVPPRKSAEMTAYKEVFDAAGKRHPDSDKAEKVKQALDMFMISRIDKEQSRHGRPRLGSMQGLETAAPQPSNTIGRASRQAEATSSHY